MFASSTTILLASVTDFIRPPLLTPALKESAMAIIVDGLTITPASRVVVKETTSDSFKLEYKNQRPNLFACPLEVQAKALKVFLVPVSYTHLTLPTPPYV